MGSEQTIAELWAAWMREESGIPFGFASVEEWRASEVARLTAELFDARRLQEAAEKHATWQDEQAKALRLELDTLRECLADAFAGYCRDNPDPDHLPEAWAEVAQDLLGAKRANAIYSAAAAREDGGA